MNPPVVYEIEVSGWLDAAWSVWLVGMTVEPHEKPDGSIVTRLVGPVRDQAALRGLLDRLFDLNLKVISMRSLDATGPAGDASSAGQSD